MPPPPIVTDYPSLTEQADADKQFPDVFVTGAVTRAMSKNVSEIQSLEPKSDCVENYLFRFFSLLFLSRIWWWHNGRIPP